MALALIVMPISKHVFIGGCERSGTTLLGSLIGGHSDCICVPESQFKISTLRSRNSTQGTIDSRTALQIISRTSKFKEQWEMEISLSQDEEKKIGENYPELLNWLTEKYGEKIGKTKASTWIDHSPENIKYAKTLLCLFPQAKFIHIIRDGRGVAASIMPLNWGPNNALEAAPWWVERVAYGLAAEDYYGIDRILRLKYEDLVTEPEQTLKSVCQFIGMHYESNMIGGGNYFVPSATYYQHKLVGLAPDAGRAVAWKQELSGREIELFEIGTRDFLSLLGYAPYYSLSARYATRQERLWLGLNSFIRRSRYWTRRKFRRLNTLRHDKDLKLI